MVFQLSHEILLLFPGTLNEVKEMKGLDIVRRDWCDLAKDAGKYVLRQLQLYFCRLMNVVISEQMKLRN